VTPDDGPLGEAYAAFVHAQRIRERLGAEIDAINAEPVEIPADLAERRTGSRTVFLRRCEAIRQSVRQDDLSPPNSSN
jgi:hypothetical protein